MDENIIKEELKKHFSKCYLNGDDPMQTAINTRDKLFSIMIEAVKEIKQDFNNLNKRKLSN